MNWLGFYNSVSIKCNWCSIRVWNKFTNIRCWDWKLASNGKKDSTNSLLLSKGIDWMLFMFTMHINSAEDKAKKNELIALTSWNVYLKNLSWIDELCEQICSLSSSSMNLCFHAQSLASCHIWWIRTKFFIQMNIHCLQLGACRKKMHVTSIATERLGKNMLQICSKQFMYKKL